MENFQDQAFFNQLKTDENLRLFIKFAGQLIHRQNSFPTDVFQTIRQFVADLDRQLSAQLNEIIHHPDLQALESAWRGLHFLVSNTDTTYWLKIRMMHLTKKELFRDFERSLTFDQSIIFKKIHDDEYGAFAGQPYNAIIGNYEFDLSPQDLLILENFAKVSAECYAPFISSASIETINTNLQNPRWQSFRRKYEAGFISLCTPQILLRNIYADKHESDRTITVESFGFTEKINSKEDYLWGNAAFALGVKLTERFSQYKWGALIEGEEDGIISAEVAKIKVLHPKEFHIIIPNSLKMIWTSDEEDRLREEGFTIISNYLASIRFLFANSCAEPLQSGNESGDLEYKRFVSLPRIFTAGRFVHHLKKMILNDRESRTIDNWRKFLNDWIKQYVAEEGRKPDANRPLEKGHVEISQDTWLKKAFEYADVLDAEIIYPNGENPWLNTVDASLCIKPAYQLPLITIDTRVGIRKLPIGTNEELPPKPEVIRNDLPIGKVNISYQTKYDGKMESLELPFVVGVIGDFIGNPLEPIYNPKQRKFVEIDNDNFDQVLAAFQPRVNFKVKNTLANDGSELEIELNFRCFEDFSADGIVRQIQPLQDLIKIRERLWKLYDRLERDYKLEIFLEELLTNPTTLHQLLEKIDNN